MQNLTMTFLGYARGHVKEYLDNLQQQHEFIMEAAKQQLDKVLEEKAELHTKLEHLALEQQQLPQRGKLELALTRAKREERIFLGMAKAETSRLVAESQERIDVQQVRQAEIEQVLQQTMDYLALLVDKVMQLSKEPGPKERGTANPKVVGTIMPAGNRMESQRQNDSGYQVKSQQEQTDKLVVETSGKPEINPSTLELDSNGISSHQPKTIVSESAPYSRTASRPIAMTADGGQGGYWGGIAAPWTTTGVAWQQEAVVNEITRVKIAGLENRAAVARKEQVAARLKDKLLDQAPQAALPEESGVKDNQMVNVQEPPVLQVASINMAQQSVPTKQDIQPEAASVRKDLGTASALPGSGSAQASAAVETELSTVWSRYVVGKLAGQDLYDISGQILVRSQEKITPEVVARAQAEGKLPELIIYMVSPALDHE